MKAKPKNPAAVALGKLAKGKRKTLTPQQRAEQAERLSAVRARRWTKPE
jgi:hypothetical protein